MAAAIGQSRHALEQEMTIRKQPEQKPVHQIFLAHDNVADLLPEPWNPLAQLSHFLRDFLRRFHKMCFETNTSEECSIKRAASGSYRTLVIRSASVIQSRI
jgi:hypothetical protein